MIDATSTTYKKPLRTSDGKFASKRAAKTAELREYVASKAAL